MQRILLLFIIICGIWGITGVGKKDILPSMIYYTQLSNAAAILSAALLLVFGPSEWIAGFRYLSVCMLVMTCLVTIFVLQPLMHNSRMLLWSRTGFFLHLVCPFLNVISYLFFEPHAGKSMAIIPPAVTLLYGIIMLYMNYIGKVDGPYPFLRIRHQSKRATVLWVIVLLAAMSVISTCVMISAG